MLTCVLSVERDLAAYRECGRCFWLRHKHRNFPPTTETVSPFAETAKTAVLEYFDRYRGRVPAYFLGQLDGKLMDDDDRLAVWRNPRKGLTGKDQYGEIALRGTLDDCFITDDRFYVPAFISFDHKERDKEEWKERQIVYDAVVYLLNLNQFETADFVYQFSYVPDPLLKTQGIGLSAKAVRIDTDPLRAEHLFAEAAALLRESELPEADPYCQVCAWFTSREDRIRNARRLGGKN